MQVFKLTSPQTTPTTIPAGTLVKTQGSTAEPEVYFETEEDLIIPIGKLGDEKSEDGKYLYSVSAVQGMPVAGELVGGSSGTPNQSFKLNYTPVLVDSLSLIINEGAGFEPWTRVDSFIDSTPTSRHYTLSLNENDEGTITFGDGVFGKIPAPYANGIYASYRIGGGKQGNVGANTVTVMETALALVDSTFNPEGVYDEGVDKETLDEIKVNAPIASTTKWGALTLQDFADVVMLNFPSVVFAHSERDGEDIDDIHIYLLTKDGATVNADLKAEIDEFFSENGEGRKIVGADEIFIEPAELKPVDLIASLVVLPRYSRSNTIEQIKAFITDYFALGNYDFGQELSLSELASLVMNSTYSGIQGVKAFYFTTPSEPVLTPTAKQIFTLGSLSINSSGGVE